MHANTNPVFMVHLTETSQLTDDVSCVHIYVVEHTYLSICFLQNNHNCDDQKSSSNNGDSV